MNIGTMESKSLLLFGAGNVGRSFVGQLFSRGGYEVVFVDIDPVIVDELNRRGCYSVEIKDKKSETIHVKGVRAVNSKDTPKVIEEICQADLLATSVGIAALPIVLKTVAAGLIERRKRDLPVIDIVIAENLREGGEKVKQLLKENLPSDYEEEMLPGLVETSIAKMVPITPEEERERDPLVVFAEAYNTLILDGKGFTGVRPDVPGLAYKDCIRAWVDRKLFMHNLAHALLCYIGYLKHPTQNMTWELLEDEQLKDKIREGMLESAQALCNEYPQEFTFSQLREHADELLERIANKALDDTVYRVGRDITRKLSRDERLVGALLLGYKHSLEMPIILEGTVSGFFFRKTDKHGKLYPKDELFVRDLFPKGSEFLIENVCGITEESLRNSFIDVFCEIKKLGDNFSA